MRPSPSTRSVSVHSPQLKALRWRLLFSSLGVIGCTLATFALVVYRTTAYSLEQKLDQQLELLADAASHQWPLRPVDGPEVSVDAPSPLEHPHPEGASLPMDDDGDLDLPWQALHQAEQSVEWFDPKGKRITHSGQLFPSLPLFETGAETASSAPPAPLDRQAAQSRTVRLALPPPKASQQDLPGEVGSPEAGVGTKSEAEAEAETEVGTEVEVEIKADQAGIDRDRENFGGDQTQATRLWRMLVLPSYQAPLGSGPAQLQGYVRVSEDYGDAEEELERLKNSLIWGSALALLLAGVGGWWLTQQSLRPIARSIHQLRQFTADASHELRNPLTAIQASVEVLQLKGDRGEPVDPAKLVAIASATRQMAQLVDDLLWLARNEQQTPQRTALIPIPIEELLEEVLDQYLALAEQRQIALLLQSTHPEAVVEGDPAQLRRLFSNLITNALQYTPPGGTVRITTGRKEDRLQIAIRDTGIGIAPEQLPLIFDRFWRADRARSHRAGGSGLGLSIAQAIVQQHQGAIAVTSQLSQGSCFQVELPWD
jgi:signal transduction histidine kinase